MSEGDMKGKPLLIPGELQFLLDCLRVSGHENAPPPGSPPRNSDWNKFWYWIKRHRVAPLLYKHMKHSGGAGIPGFIQQRLRTEFHGNTIKCLAWTARIIQLISLFEENAIPAIPLKGQILSQQIYGDIDSRHAGDIDVLIAPANIEKAHRLLVDNGYRPVTPMKKFTPRQKKTYRKIFRHQNYESQAPKIAIELHWRLLPNHLLFFDFERLYADAPLIIVAGKPIRVLPEMEQLLYLFVHGATHAWFRLKWLYDAAHILSQFHRTDWVRLMTTAKQYDVLRPVAQGALAAHVLFASPLPDSVRALIRRDSVIESLVRIAFCRIVDPESIGVPALMLDPYYHLRLRKNMRYKLSVLHEWVHCSDDWLRLPLPDALFPLYALFRPFLWANRRILGNPLALP